MRKIDFHHTAESIKQNCSAGNHDTLKRQSPRPIFMFQIVLKQFIFNWSIQGKQTKLDKI